jgi:hypothetical protein
VYLHTQHRLGFLTVICNWSLIFLSRPIQDSLWLMEKGLGHWVLVAHICNPSHSRGRNQEDQGLKPVWANSWQDPISKKPIWKEKRQGPGPHWDREQEARVVPACTCRTPSLHLNASSDLWLGNTASYRCQLGKPQAWLSHVSSCSKLVGRAF